MSPRNLSRFPADSCPDGVDGAGSYLELLKTAAFLRNSSSWSSRIDFSRNYSVSGHSTGARSVLQLAALKDTRASYMSQLPGASLLTPTLQRELWQIGAVISNHPDSMYNPKYNPDLAHYAVFETPVFIITGSADTTIEERGSAWRDFSMLQTPDKVFVDVKGADHSEPIEGHRMGDFIAAYSRLYALGDSSSSPAIFGTGPKSIRGSIAIAGPSDPNTGGGGPGGNQSFGYLGCRKGSPSVPAGLDGYC